MRNHTERMGKLCIAICFVLVLGGCKLLTPSTVRTILNAAEWTCILLEQATDASEVMQACGIANDLRPAVEQAVAGKAAATRAGYRSR